MPAEAPFFFSIAALSASVAGFAGLVAAFRRAEGLRPIDLYRLREIVELAFANSIIALTVVAVAGALEMSNTVRPAGVVILVVLLVHSVGLYVRMRRFSLPLQRSWLVGAAAIDVVAVALAIIAAISGSTTALELMLVALLARPMIAFLLVLTLLETIDR